MFWGPELILFKKEAVLPRKILPLCPFFPNQTTITSESVSFWCPWSPFSMLHWVSACTGSWGLGILGAKNCFSAAQCGMLLMLTKAQWATMDKPFPQHQGKTSHIWQIWAFKTHFYSPWKWLIMFKLRWIQPISVQFYAKKSSLSTFLCWTAGEGSSLPALKDGTCQMMVHRAFPCLPRALGCAWSSSSILAS